MTAFVENNEGLICDAVVHFLEENTGDARTDLSYPELEGGPGSVELLLNLGCNQYALEHTMIESFPYQIKFNVNYNQVIQPVLDKVRECGLPKPGQYQLLLPLDVYVDANANNFRELQSLLIQWVCDTAKELHAKRPMRLSRDICPAGHYEDKKVSLEGFRYEITLVRRVRWNDPVNLDGVLFADRILTEDMKKKQCERILTALEKKKKKLNYRKRLGAQTVLVLENNNWPLTSCVEIGECVVELLPNQPGWLDELFCMEAAIKPWKLYRWNWDESNWHYGKVEYDPACLNDISAKLAKQE